MVHASGGNNCTQRITRHASYVPAGILKVLDHGSGEIQMVLNGFKMVSSLYCKTKIDILKLVSES